MQSSENGGIHIFFTKFFVCIYEKKSCDAHRAVYDKEPANGCGGLLVGRYPAGKHPADSGNHSLDRLCIFDQKRDQRTDSECSQTAEACRDIQILAAGDQHKNVEDRIHEHIDDA